MLPVQVVSATRLLGRGPQGALGGGEVAVEVHLQGITTLGPFCPQTQRSAGRAPAAMPRGLDIRAGAARTMDRAEEKGQIGGKIDASGWGRWTRSCEATCRLVETYRTCDLQFDIDASN